MQRKTVFFHINLVIIENAQNSDISVTVQGQAEGRYWAYPFNVAVDGDRQERRVGGLLLWRFFLIDKSRTPSVHKKYTHLKKKKRP